MSIETLIKWWNNEDLMFLLSEKKLDYDTFVFIKENRDKVKHNIELGVGLVIICGFIGLLLVWS